MYYLRPLEMIQKSLSTGSICLKSTKQQVKVSWFKYKLTHARGEKRISFGTLNSSATQYNFIKLLPPMYSFFKTIIP